MRSKSWSWIFIGFLFAALHTAALAQVTTTQVTDTIYHADGTTASGTVLIAWPAFTSSSGQQVPAGNTSAVIGTGGALSVNLVANSGAIPVGAYYTVTYHLDDNTVTRQYWVVPQSATPVRIAAISSTVLPTSVAMQMVTRSYVDTAIAAATTGHPLDTSPLVLKTGDTMTGPLVLPADPVSSLQAATKGYVDTAVASSGGGGGGLSGQTINSLPLATSATASTTSSHFYETGGFSGVNNPLRMFATAPNCNVQGPSFFHYSCNFMGVLDDGSTDTTPGSGGSKNLAGFTRNMNAWGPSGGYDDGRAWEHRVTALSIDSNSGALVTAGIKPVNYSNTTLIGIGDASGLYQSNMCWTGMAYGSDQGCQNFLRIGESAGNWFGVIDTGSTNTQLSIVSGSDGGCFEFESQVCAPSPGAWMLDTSVIRASGNVTSAPSNGAIGLPWMSQSSTSFSPPATTAWGFHIDANIAPPGATYWDSPLPTTFSISGGFGTFAAGDHACVIGSNFTEQNIVSAVSGAAPNQTITMPLVMPEVSIAVFKGDCMYMAFDADAAHNVLYALPTVSIDGTNILYTYPVHGEQQAAVLPHDGWTWAVFDGGASSGVRLYAGARITKIGTTDPTHPFPFNAPNIQVYLEPSTAFNVGDSLLNAHFNAQKIDGLEVTAIGTIASTDTAPVTGIWSHLIGHGISEQAAAFRGRNDEPTSSYKLYGGPLSEPHFIEQRGPFDDFLRADTTPATNLFYFQSHQPGQTSYNILRDPSWGEFSIDDTSTFKITDAGLSVQNDAHFGFHVVTGVGFHALDGGISGVGMSFGLANTANGTDWLAPCSQYTGSSNTDLCLGALGASRVGFDLPPDRGLQVANLTVAGGANPTYIDFGAHYGVDAIDMYHSGSSIFGWGLNAGQMQFYLGDPTGSPFSNFTFNNGPNGLQPAGTNEFMRLNTPTETLSLASNGVYGFASTNIAGGGSSGTVDTGISRDSAGVLDVGNGTAGDASGTLHATGGVFSGTINAGLYQGPATAPTGACSAVGWALSQDGHISYCDGTSWALKM